MANIVIYTKSHCPFCRGVKALLREKKASFIEVEISDNDRLRQEMIERSGRTTVPQIFIGAEHIGGHDDLVALEQSGELDAKLNAAAQNS